MEHVHGVDVSWMTHGAPKDKVVKNGTSRRSSVSNPQNREPPSPVVVAPTNDPNDTNDTNSTNSTNGNGNSNSSPPNDPKHLSPSKPSFIRSNSAEKNTQSNTPLQRKSSWFTNISSKFSSSSPSQQAPQQAEALPPSQNALVPKISPARNAVLQHAAKVDGTGPYTPAPPRNAGFLGVFRRLSSTSGSGPATAVKGNHGLVERVVLNVDKRRERCKIKELNQAKLRRVAFCVDVEIAPMPKYAESSATTKMNKTQKKKLTEKGEAEALKHPEKVVEQKEQDGIIEAAGESVPNEPEEDGFKQTEAKCDPEPCPDQPKETSVKKKEKKKKSEEERKARKEKKRQLAEANGSIPMEIHRSSTDSTSSASPTTKAPPKTHTSPTTNPVRIYRRCCQLRESPILKKITEQLMTASNSVEQGVIEKLDLTGYFMDLPDLVTLGDYFAVVPVKEVILEGCGMTDEGMRVVFAGLLATKKPEFRRRRLSTTDGLTHQGGVVERVVVKNNKIGPEGWRHISLFICMCRSLKQLDVSGIRFPRSIHRVESPLTITHEAKKTTTMDFAHLLGKSIGDRLGGCELELLNLGETELKPEQLGVIMDGIIKCGVRRLGLANNGLDDDGLQHIARYLRDAKCEGLDLGGNDLREKLESLGDSLLEAPTIWALSLANCNLYPASLCKLFHRLVKLPNVRFIDLSHNRDLFHWDPSAVGLLRRYLPKMPFLKRIHLADVAMTPEQAIQIIEILPEIPHLAHISFMENPRLVSLADAKTEESQEEACALYASLLAATRVSKTIVCVDIDIPRESSGEVVKALAKQVVAYCLRNMEQIQVSDLGASAVSIHEALPDTQSQSSSTHDNNNVPDALLNLVGHDFEATSSEDEGEVAPDEDYVIGGTGVVKALAVCLKNRGDESRRGSGEFIREVETGSVEPRARLPPGKAKDMSKHLLLSARKIRVRLQPALAKAKANKSDRPTYHRLIFLDHTLDGMIKRFEDEFPDTKEYSMHLKPATIMTEPSSTNMSPVEMAEPPLLVREESGILSEEDETDIKSRSRSNSILSNTSKALAEEEGRTLRTGHKFRRGFLKQEHYEVLGALEELKADPNHVYMLTEMLEELGDDYLKQRAAEIGVVETFKSEKERLFRRLRDIDPSHWDRFIESQEKAIRNVAPGGAAVAKVGDTVVEENAVDD
ncbi:putative cell wall biogenesis protein mhp1 protein [Zalerion maritima]|uniref:Cell wall biogenesis protein mhp1 protein n=1 Tax=Zalerion maritima TaxID=339359 RepID=A0AAD5WP34_9PEZI|nr:putative cell wall biogenesis protein mhp1 protein [Zalerion maritima]